MKISHGLTNAPENMQLYAYESSVRESFDNIVPTLKQISALQHEANFEQQAQQLARTQLGFELPDLLLNNAWVDQLDMRSLFAWSVFETYHRFCDEVFTHDPLGQNGSDASFQRFIQECGFHMVDVSPCADGRLAHVIRYVLRMPYKEVRRRSYAGAMFDIEDSLEKWVKTELLRFREGKPNTPDSATRYLKTVVYHHSSVDPNHQGCAAHGSDTSKAAQGGLERLMAFQQAVQNTHCCGASIDCLLIGMDTDTDSIRIHMPDANGNIDLENHVDSLEVFDATASMNMNDAEQWITDHIQQKGGNALTSGMARFMSYLMKNNMSQVEYVRSYYGGCYSDIGHAERFIGAGIGFEEIQLRNLTFFSYLNTVEEAATDLDVGISIFTGLNVSQGLPVPIVVRYDYHGNVPGARERAEEHCQRVADALHNRYSELTDRGMLHTLQVVRDINGAGQIEILDCSVKTKVAGGH
ncbi:carboxysome shell carbonic anhydrase [Sulfuriflexus mobilis]|uniref:carboxysome shell carbonic anhydrase n=1 Tax=Sulfuriflexus mobilis TaxID=1811807 RepID=UPI001E553045|nr:carboxysome shell carbonic anhydrase [Sulfuriflexus mobilis]